MAMRALLSCVRPGAARLRWVSESLQRGHEHRRRPTMSATRSAIAGTGAMLLNGQERASENNRPELAAPGPLITIARQAKRHQVSVSSEGAQAPRLLSR